MESKEKKIKPLTREEWDKMPDSQKDDLLERGVKSPYDSIPMYRRGTDPLNPDKPLPEDITFEQFQVRYKKARRDGIVRRPFLQRITEDNYKKPEPTVDIEKTPTVESPKTPREKITIDESDLPKATEKETEKITIDESDLPKATKKKLLLIHQRFRKPQRLLLTNQTFQKHQTTLA